MKKHERLEKKQARRLTNEVELQLKRGLIHLELIDSAEVIKEDLAEVK